MIVHTVYRYFNIMNHEVAAPIKTIFAIPCFKGDTKFVHLIIKKIKWLF